MDDWNGEVRMHLMSSLPFATKWVGALLRLLEAEALFAPVTMRVARGAKRDFDRDALLRQLRRSYDRIDEVSWRRERKVRHQATLLLAGAFGTHLLIELGKDRRRKPADIEALFAFGDRLAAVMVADLGIVQPITREAAYDAHDRAGYRRVTDLYKVGLVGLAARTWLGPRVVALAGSELDELTESVEGYGGVRIDVCEQPWDHGIDERERARATLEPAVRQTGLLGEITPAGLSGEPGPRWQPPDVFPAPTR